MYYLIFSYLFIRIDNFMFYKNIYKLFFRNPEIPWNGMPKSAGTEIFHSTGQIETGSETVLITMPLTTLTADFDRVWLLTFLVDFDQGWKFSVGTILLSFSNRFQFWALFLYLKLLNHPNGPFLIYFFNPLLHKDSQTMLHDNILFANLL